MRISIPSIPQSASTRQHIEYTIEAATKLIGDVLQQNRGKALIMTGAGVSVDSGIAPYRGKDGHYTVHKTYRPIFFHEFTDESPKGHQFRQRYWSRSFLGYPPVMRALPNKTHYAVAALQRLGYFQDIITQNVDSLHHAATPSSSLAAETILELHGTLQNVVCVASPPGAEHHHHGDHVLGHESHERQRPKPAPRDPTLYDRLTQSHLVQGGPRKPATPLPWNTPVGQSAYPRGCGFRGNRAMYQAELAQRNPQWAALASDMAEHNTEPKTNPDGDVQLGGDVDYSTFQYSACPQCGGILKPAVVFFGESVPELLRDRSYELVDRNDALVLVGTSLATYSAFRLVKAAQEQGKRTLLINRGPTRADNLVDDKIDLGSSETFHAVANMLAGGHAERGDPVLRRLLHSGETLEPQKQRGVVSS